MEDERLIPTVFNNLLDLIRYYVGILRISKFFKDPIEIA